MTAQKRRGHPKMPLQKPNAAYGMVQKKRKSDILEHGDPLDGLEL